MAPSQARNADKGRSASGGLSPRSGSWRGSIRSGQENCSTAAPRGSIAFMQCRNPISLLDAGRVVPPMPTINGFRVAFKTAHHVEGDYVNIVHYNKGPGNGSDAGVRVQCDRLRPYEVVIRVLIARLVAAQ